MDTLQRPARNGTVYRVETLTRPTRRSTRAWIAILTASIAIAIVAALIAIVHTRTAAAVSYQTVPVVRQDLVQSVTATGTVNPQNTIAVGTQESGTITEVDVDFNSRVRRGQVLARLDPTTFQAALEQARAQLTQAQAQARSAQATANGAQSSIGSAVATQRASQATSQAALATARSNQAGVVSANAAVERSQSAASLAQQTVGRDQQLLAQGYIAQSQLDSDRSNLVAAQTALDAARAGVQQAVEQAAASASQAQASAAQTAATSYQTSSAQSGAQTQTANAAASEASVAGAEAQVRQAQLNLQKTIIISPVDGTVVARNVAIGVTVAASFQTPTLFSIAQDLNRMEVDLSVGEPDIGNVRSGDGVDFSVLAYPNETFHGIASQVRIDPVTTQNVVTYATVVLVDNRAGRLLPGMTANASIHVAKSPNALVVPLAALAYQPAAGGGAGHHRRSGSQATTGSSAAAAGRPSPGGPSPTSPWGSTSGNAGALVSAGSRSRVFVLRDGKVVRVPVSVTLVSGTQAAVNPLAGVLAANESVVTGDSAATGAPVARQNAAGAGNPMTGAAGGPGGAMRGIH
ncbi:MAG: efflux RND transporter periplasmic adaptor subunit [Candidatus Eremiobacteraeota bacterium]|nr:efflux RND transporter periplasmic adaptor subunit [Candidatus Eremiobacteraeota bacterium]